MPRIDKYILYIQKISSFLIKHIARLKSEHTWTGNCYPI